MLLLVAGILLAVVAVVPAGAAAKPCSRQVIDDWYDDGRVDGAYPLHCYDDAIDALPRDVRDYSSAKEDIQRALQARMLKKPAPPARTDPSPDDPPPAQDPTDFDDDGLPNERDPTPGEQVRDPGENDDPPERPTSPESETEDETEVVADVDTTRSDALPLPLLVLGGLALLLVAAGSAGYLVRRLQARRISPPGP